jgi:nucleoside-diphosphate-sugar epimerase
LQGAAGFIGSHVADSLRAEGHEVAVVDDLSCGRHQNVPEAAAFYKLDVSSGCEEAPPSAAYVSQKLIAEAYRQMLILR